MNIEAILTDFVLRLPAAQDPGALAGSAGWVGAGLLGSVLAWMFLVQTPAKDKQLKEMLDAATTEREKDRTARHEVAEKFQQVIMEMMLAHDKLLKEYLTTWTAEREKDRTSRHDTADRFQAALGEMIETHHRDAEKDREAFMARNNRVEDAIKLQTAELKLAIATSCRAGLAAPALVPLVPKIQEGKS